MTWHRHPEAALPRVVKQWWSESLDRLRRRPAAAGRCGRPGVNDWAGPASKLMVPGINAGEIKVDHPGPARMAVQPGSL